MSLEVHGLTVRFGGADSAEATTAVDDVSLTVPEGEVLGLVGPSGCGKSTLLRAIAGLVVPDAGTIAWAGSSLVDVPVERRGIGFMFQAHALFNHRTVAENVAFGLKMAGVARAERDERVDELLELVGLGGFGRRSVEQLSGGEAQRVALARALAPRPRLLLLDEPLAALDRARRDQLNRDLTELLRELGQTAIHVTHDQHEAFAAATQIAVMHRGRIMRAGTATEVWRDPRSRFVASFIGHETIIERGGQHFAVRADALTITPATTRPLVDDVAGREPVLVATVLACAFQGDRFQVEVEVEATSMRFTGFCAEPLALGDQALVAIDAARLAPLTD